MTFRKRITRKLIKNYYPCKEFCTEPHHFTCYIPKKGLSLTQFLMLPIPLTSKLWVLEFCHRGLSGISLFMQKF